MPVLVVSWGVTTSAWWLAQLLDVRIVTIDDLTSAQDGETGGVPQWVSLRSSTRLNALNGS